MKLKIWHIAQHQKALEKNYQSEQQDQVNKKKTKQMKIKEEEDYWRGEEMLSYIVISAVAYKTLRFKWLSSLPK